MGSGKVFISYVREDAELVRVIRAIFDQNGVAYWYDREDLAPGGRWQAEIRRAIHDGALFLSVNTANSARRERSGAYEELVVAIDELRKRSPAKPWLIQLRLDSCRMPDNEIGGGETLSNLQWIDVDDLGWHDAMARLLRACGVEAPEVDHGEPLGPGLPSTLELRRGRITYDRTVPSYPGMIGLNNSIQGGFIARDEGRRIVVRCNVLASTDSLQKLSEQMGMAELVAVCGDDALSQEPEKPSVFRGTRGGTFRAGTRVPVAGHGDVPLPDGGEFRARYTASVYTDGEHLRGSFEADVVVTTLGGREARLRQFGTVDAVVTRP